MECKIQAVILQHDREMTKYFNYFKLGVIQPLHVEIFKAGSGSK